ncbi:MAG: S41 family peptidase, partial [Clostridia bacterium]|nr:S41 family peptidase [Clostridia bacterium]
MKLKLDYKKIISEVITASLIIIISGIAIYSFIIISDQGVDVYNNSPKVEVMKGTNKIQEVLSIIENKYMEEVDVSKLIDGAIEGIFDSMEDQYTRYLTEEEYEEIKTQGNEKFTGIGVHISRKVDTGEMVVVSVMPNTPAKESGILSGDIILKVNDIEVTEDNYTESVNNIKGEPGTIVNLVIKRGEEVITKGIKRRQLTENNVESEVLPENIGYIRILEFENGIYDQFKTEYDDLINNKKVKGLIVDVRNNPGGIVSETVKIADLICGEGKILETIYRDGSKKVYMSDKNKIEIPLVILINEASASASEILAGAV